MKIASSSDETQILCGAFSRGYMRIFTFFNLAFQRGAAEDPCHRLSSYKTLIM